MNNRILCLTLALSLALPLAACGSRPMQEMEEAVESVLPTAEPVKETASPLPETPDVTMMPEEADLSVEDVLESIRDAKADEAGTAVMTYVAAARVLTFCQKGGAQRADFQQDVKAWIDRLDGEAREAFIASARAVAELAQRIAQGDVERSELEEHLADSDTDWEDFDPVSFQHENLQRFVDVVTSALED